jgi:ATP-binding cassette subfamily F protein 3
LFYAEDIEKPCYVLSGGEKARLGLLKIMLSKPNLLLLDEPTNHLDITGREALENALKNYDGAILAISHDRYFINALAEKVLLLENAQLTEYCGNYEYYLEKRAATPTATQDNTPAAPAKAPSDNKLAYQARKEQAAAQRRLQTRLTKLEETIADTETQIAEIETQLADPKIAANYQEAAALDQQADLLRQKLEAAMNEWEETALALEEGAQQ